MEDFHKLILALFELGLDLREKALHEGFLIPLALIQHIKENFSSQSLVGIPLFLLTDLSEGFHIMDNSLIFLVRGDRIIF